jgi:predicted NAD/FAD-binding protein
MTVARGQRVAVIGGGIAGLTAAYLLGRSHRVTLFEKEPRLGGNAYSFTPKPGEPALDVAVAAFGLAGYGNFYALLEELGLPSAACAKSYMSLHDLDTHAGLYLTPTLKGVAAQRFALVKPRTLASLVNLMSGLRRSQARWERGELAGATFAEALDAETKISGDAKKILLCALCLMSSMDAPEVLATPAAFFLGKLRRHDDVISPKAMYSVRCVAGGTRAYVERLGAAIAASGEIRRGLGVASVRRRGSGVVVVDRSGGETSFDHVVFACNADQALALLADPSPLETELLSPWRYKEGRVVVHRDHRSFPARELIQAYTFLYTDRGGELRTSVNGALWHQPSADPACDYISTQHPNFEIRPELTALDVTLRTPIFDFASIATIPRLPSLNGRQNTWYCGSHFGFGLHDDAVSSAMHVAGALGSPFTRGAVTNAAAYTIKSVLSDVWARSKEAMGRMS